MKPEAAWIDYRKTMSLPDQPRLRAIFLGGFSAGMGWVAEVSNVARKDALEEIQRMLDAARLEDAKHPQ